MALHADPSTEFQRSAEIRSAAQRALFKLADKEAVHRAQNARSRAPHKTELRHGDVVYVWRNKLRDNTKGWIGPGLVVCVQDTPDSIWVSMRGVLVKCNRDRVRMATDSEWIGAELIICQQTPESVWNVMVNEASSTPRPSQDQIRTTSQLLASRFPRKLILVRDLYSPYPKNRRWQVTLRMCP